MNTPLADWFLTHESELPQIPFRLKRWEWVNDPSTFYKAMREDILLKRRSRNEAVEEDLEALRKIWEEEKKSNEMV